MAFKSYAKGGSYSSYAINLPANDEINEDLRVAGGKIQDIQQTARLKAGHTEAYKQALNSKFQVEQQNRDDNARFMLENYQAIYEGEQDQFEGELSELKRDYAESQQKRSEPSTLEKALPHILKLVTIGAQIYEGSQAAATEAKVNQVTEFGQQSAAANMNMGAMMVNPEITGATPEIRNEWFQSAAIRWQNTTGASVEERQRFLANMKAAYNAKGEVLEAWQGTALANANNNAIYLTKTDASTNPARFSSPGEHAAYLRKTYNRNLRNYLGGGAPGTDEGVVEGSRYLAKVGPRVMQGHYKQANRFFNSELNAGLKVHEQNSRKDYILGIHSRALDALKGTGPFSNNDLGSAQNLFKLWEEVRLIDSNGDVRSTMEIMTEVLLADSRFGPDTIRELQGLVRSSNPGTAAANPEYQTQIDKGFTKILEEKEKDKVATIYRHNQLKRIQGQDILNQVNAIKSRSERLAFIKGLDESGQLETLPADVRKSLNAELSGYQNSAKAQAKKYSSYFPTAAVRDRVETEMTKLVLDKYPNVKEVNISAWELQKVISDTMRLLPGEIGLDEPGFKENPEVFFDAALKKALEGQEWSIEKTGLTADVGVTGKRTNQPQQVLETNLGKVDLTNPGPQLREIFLANKGHLDEFRGYSDQINRWYENNPGQEMSYTDLANSPMLNSHMVTSFIEASNDPTLSRSNAFMQLIEAASDGKAPNISSAVITRSQVAAAQAAGVTARPEGRIGAGVYSGTATITPSSYNKAVTGNSGRSTGPHLDFGATDAAGNEIDPNKYIDSLYVGDTPLNDLYDESSGYGWRSDPFTGRQKWHAGRDRKTPMGTEITVRGGVLIDEFNDEGGWGHSKVYRMPDGGTVRLSHLQGGGN